MKLIKLTEARARRLWILKSLQGLSVGYLKRSRPGWAHEEPAHHWYPRRIRSRAKLYHRVLTIFPDCSRSSFNRDVRTLADAGLVQLSAWDRHLVTVERRSYQFHKRGVCDASWTANMPGGREYASELDRAAARLATLRNPGSRVHWRRVELAWSGRTLGNYWKGRIMARKWTIHRKSPDAKRRADPVELVHKAWPAGRIAPNVVALRAVRQAVKAERAAAARVAAVQVAAKPYRELDTIRTEQGKAVHAFDWSPDLDTGNREEK